MINTTEQVKSYEVVYSVKFKCVVDVEPGEDLFDNISNIIIPEGQRNYSEYLPGTFEKHSCMEITDGKSPEKVAEKKSS